MRSGGRHTVVYPPTGRTRDRGRRSASPREAGADTRPRLSSHSCPWDSAALAAVKSDQRITRPRAHLRAIPRPVGPWLPSCRCREPEPLQIEISTAGLPRRYEKLGIDDAKSPDRQASCRIGKPSNRRCSAQSMGRSHSMNRRRVRPAGRLASTNGERRCASRALDGALGHELQSWAVHRLDAAHALEWAYLVGER